MSTLEQFIHEAALLTLTDAKVAKQVVQEKLDEHGVSHRLSLTVHCSIIARAIRIRNARRVLYNRSQMQLV
ncbi:MAG: hypothetical protein [Bacteriophage sp.]|nr:MAG: hypothetical protein [Bacteriophage sp.]